MLSSLFFFAIISIASVLVTWPSDVTALNVASRRSDDVSVDALETTVQQQAAALQQQQAQLQAMENHLSLLQQSVSGHSAALNTISTRLNTRVFFTAHTGASTVTMGTDSPVKFDTLVTHIGSAYDPSTGVFTAPVSGVYVFYAQLMNQGSSPTIHWGIAKGGNFLCMATNEAANSYDKGSCLATVQLQQGEKVFVRRARDGTPGMLLQGGPWCSFSGYLTSVDV